MFDKWKERREERRSAESKELKGSCTELSEEASFPSKERDQWVIIGEGNVCQSHLKTIYSKLNSSSIFTNEEEWTWEWGKVEPGMGFESMLNANDHCYYPSVDDIDSTIQLKVSNGSQTFFSNKLYIEMDSSLKRLFEKRIGNQSFDVYVGNHQKKALSLGRNRVMLCNRVHSNEVHNLPGETLVISVDPSIEVVPSDNRDSSFSILVRNQTFVNLEGMIAYGNRNDREGLFTFSLEADSPFERDLIVLCLRRKFARGKNHELDRSATTKDLTSVVAIGLGREFTMTENDWTLLSINANEYYYQKGRIIFKEGMSNRSLYRILGGYVQIIKEKASNNGVMKVTIGRMGPGSLIGEMSLLGEGVSTASVIAETDVRISEVPLDFIRTIFNVESDLAMKLFHNLSLRLALRFQSLVNGRREQPAPRISEESIQEEGAGFIFKRKNACEVIKSGEDFMVIREYEGKHHKMPGAIQMHAHRMIFQTGFLGVVMMKIINYSDIVRVDSINRGEYFGISISLRGKRRSRTFLLQDEKERDKLAGILESVVNRLETQLTRKELSIPLPEAKKTTEEQSFLAHQFLKESEGDWKELLGKTKRTTIPSGTFLFNDGKPEKLYEIISGTCRIERNGATIVVLGEGDIVGLMSFLGISPVFGSVIANSDVELLIIDSEELKKVIQKNPQIGSQFFKHVAQILDNRVTRAEEMAFPPSTR